MTPISPILSRISLFSGLDESELTRLAEIVINRSFRKNTNVFMEGSPRQAVYFIQKGIIKIYKIDSEGNEQVVSFLKEGDMFPHTGFFDTSPYPATAEAVEQAELFVIPVMDFEQLMLERPSIAIKVMRVMGEKIRELQSKLQEFVTQDVNRRIISFLIRIADKHGQPEDGGIRVRLPITHQEFANMVGTTRETVNRVMNQLKKEGLLEMNRHGLIIHQMDAIRQMQL